jgi:DNA-binding GntR family transcriptional regulator
MRPREAASAAAVARMLRAEILAGVYDADGKVPSRVELANRHRVSPETASVVLRMLAAEGWVTLDQGRGTFLRPRRRFLVSAMVERTEGAAPLVNGPGQLQQAIAAAVQAAAEAEPAAISAEASASPEHAHVLLTVQAVSSATAMAVAEGLMESMREPWSWDGWDLPAPNVSARLA